MKRIVIITATALTLSGCMSIGPDKYLHAYGGALVAVSGKTVGLTDKQACAASLAVGIAKEVIDPIFSIPDVFATAVVCVPLLLKDNNNDD